MYKEATSTAFLVEEEGVEVEYEREEFILKALQNIKTRQDILEPHKSALLSTDHSNEDVLPCPDITSPKPIDSGFDKFC